MVVCEGVCLASAMWALVRAQWMALVVAERVGREQTRVCPSQGLAYGSWVAPNRASAGSVV